MLVLSGGWLLIGNAMLYKVMKFSATGDCTRRHVFSQKCIHKVPQKCILNRIPQICIYKVFWKVYLQGQMIFSLLGERASV